MNPLFLFLLPIVLVSARHLQVGFYNSSCPEAESIVQSVVQKHFGTDPSIAPALIRLYFHDCSTRGCDASILIDSTKKVLAEKFAGTNRSLRGFEIIDEAKSKLEAQCPSTVSCADVIALATRDALVLAGGVGYGVPTGRRDGLRSSYYDVEIPGPDELLSDVTDFFISKGLTAKDMVILLGSHTVGEAHCHNFRTRLLVSRKTGRPFDTTMDTNLKAKLLQICGEDVIIVDGIFLNDSKAYLDQNTPMTFDNSFYSAILEHKGVLQFDQQVALDNSTRETVENLATDNDGFLKNFAKSMVKLGNVGVLVGKEGEIRKNCRVFNKRS